MNQSFGYDSYGHSTNYGDDLLNEIHYLKEKVKTTEEKQTEQEYWNQLLASNIRAGTMACMWCLKAQVLKKLSLAFNKWKYTSIMSSPSNSSRQPTPLKHRVISNVEAPGNVSSAVAVAIQQANISPLANNESAPFQPAQPVVQAVQSSLSNQSILSSVMDIQYNSANSAHLNRYLQNTLSDKTTDFDTKRKILLAMSNDIIDRGQRERASHTPEKSPHKDGDGGSVVSRQSLSTIRSDLPPHLAHQAPRSQSTGGIAASQQQVRSPLHELARSESVHHSHQHNLSLDMEHVGGSNAQPVNRSRSNSLGSSAGGAAAAAHSRGYTFNRSPARGRWTEADPVPEHKPAQGDFKYLVFKNNDSGNYVRELLASPVMVRQPQQSHPQQRSSSANRATRTPPPTAGARSSASVASGGSHSANFHRYPAEAALNASGSASVSSRSKHDVRHRINTLETSRLSSNTSSSAVPRYMLPTNTYIKKILTSEEAAQFSVIGHNMSGGMNRTAHKHHQQQKSMVSRAARHQHEREHSGGGTGRTAGNDTFNYNGSPYRGELDQDPVPVSSSSPRSEKQQQPYVDSYIPQSERDRRAWPNEPADTPPSSSNALNTQQRQQEAPVDLPPHLSDATHRILRQPHFVTAAMENFSGISRPPAPNGPQHHQRVNYDEFYSDGGGAATLPRGAAAAAPVVDSPHVQEYADLVYSAHPVGGHTQPVISTESAGTIVSELSQHQPGQGGLFSSYANSQSQNQGTDGYGFTYTAQRNEQGNYVTSAGYHEPTSSSGAVGGSYSPGGHYYSHNDYDHYEGEYDEEQYHQQSRSGSDLNNSRLNYSRGGADSGTYYDEGHDVSSSNTSYQSYMLHQNHSGGRRVFDMKKKSPGGGASVGGGSNSKGKSGKKPIDKAQMKLFYGHLMDANKDSWSRTLRM